MRCNSNRCRTSVFDAIERVLSASLPEAIS